MTQPSLASMLAKPTLGEVGGAYSGHLDLHQDSAELGDGRLNACRQVGLERGISDPCMPQALGETG